ncbi:MAG: PD-(D/E)XK nuclease family protein [Spirochaetales bacterium]|nr:PD-(D/E)XK nuclease family protein [Spirochaetales bacterium]
MNNILPIIEKHITDRNKIFIFPSQVAADFWRRKILDNGTVSAVRWERFQSWDSFKEELFALNRKELPVNSRIRRIFASDLIKRFSKGEIIFESLLNPDFKETSGIFQGYLSGLLPHLKSFLELVETGTGDIEARYLSDMKMLYTYYLEFMSRFNLFEPSWVTPVMGEDSSGRILFFPELIEDWDELAPQLESNPLVEIIHLEEEFPLENSRGLVSYCTSRLEVEDFCRRAVSLLKQGETDIAVTLADKDLISLLAESAALYDIPLNFHLGTSLGETQEGMFFSRIRECRDENFSLRSMKALLLNGAYPWKEQELIRELIYFGAETHCLRNIDNSKGGDLWARMISMTGYRRGGEPGALLKFYSDLKIGILGLTSAGSFSDFSRSLELFLNRFLDTDNWAAEGLAVFQRCRRSITDLKVLEDKLTGLELPAPLDFLIQDLGGITYVVQRTGGGIPVYAYRVSAGIVPKYHFVLGLSHAASRILTPPFPFLREDQRAGFALEEKDFSDDFILSYLSSGENVNLTTSEQTLGGPTLPAGFFVVHGLVSEAARLDNDEQGVLGDKGADPYLAELEFWKGEVKHLPEGLSPVQKEGAAAGNNGFHPRGWDMNSQALKPDDFRREALAPLRKGRGGEGHDPSGAFSESSYSSDSPASHEAPLRLSPYRLDKWAACPLSYYFQYGLDLGEIPFEAEWSDPKALGNLRHEILHRFFKGLGAGKFDPSAGEEYALFMEEAAAAVFAEWEKREPLTATPFWFVLKRQVHREVFLFLEGERKQFPGFGVLELESLHELMVGDVLLSGKIDRVSEKNGTLSVIDYKSNVYQSLSGMFGVEGFPFSFQMPIYILFMRAEEHVVESAAYFDMKKGKYFSMLDPEKPASAELMEAAMEILTEELLRFQQEAAAGTFFPNTECDSCDYRFICRTKYVIREAVNG